MPRRFVRPRPRPVRSGRQASSKRTGRVHCHCHRGFAIIAPSICSAAGPIAPTIAGSNISSTIATKLRLAAVVSASAIAIGAVSCAVIHDATALAAPGQNPKDRRIGRAMRFATSSAHLGYALKLNRSLGRHVGNSVGPILAFESPGDTSSRAPSQHRVLL